MADELSEQIITQVKTDMATITDANGYKTDMAAARVFGPKGIPELDSSDLPALILEREEIDPRWHLRGAHEFILRLRVRAAASTKAAVANLLADVIQLADANYRWNDGSTNLAQRTWVSAGPDLHEPEVDEDTKSGWLILSILARADRTDPTAVKAV